MTESKLSDADVLERAAEIMRARRFACDGTLSAPGNFEKLAEKLRAAPPSKGEADVFEHFARAVVSDPHEDVQSIAALARDHFGPLVEALEFYAGWTKIPGSRRNPSPIMDDAGDNARAALSALRARAGGRS